MKRRATLAPRLALAAALIGLGSSCGPSPAAGPPPRLGPAESEAPLCQLSGEWTSGHLRAPRGGYRFAQLHGASAEARLVRVDGQLRIQAQVARDGWHLVGWSDPVEDGLLSVRRRGWIIPGVALAAGASPTVRDARPGEALIGVPPFGLGVADRFRFLVPVERWVPCSELDMSFRVRDDRTSERERVALGFPAELPRKSIPVAETPAPLAAEPGGRPFAEIPRAEHPMSVLLVEERGTDARVLIQDWTGLAIVGWLSGALLEDPAGGGLANVFGMLGSGGGPRAITVCTSPESLSLLASKAGAGAEPVGFLEAGTRFVRGLTNADGTVPVSPHHSAGVSLAGSDIQLSARPLAPLSCTEETYDPAAALRALLPRPAAILRLELEVTAVEGLAGVEVGTGCVARVEHHPASRHPCRVEARCGEQILYGHRPNNGYLVSCEIEADATPPSVSGEDGHPTSDGGGDGAVRLDTAAGTFQASDSADGHLGAFSLDARIRSVQREQLEATEEGRP